MSLLPRWFWKIMLVLWIISLVVLTFNSGIGSPIKVGSMALIFGFGIYYAIKMLNKKESQE